MENVLRLRHQYTVFIKWIVVINSAGQMTINGSTIGKKKVEDE